MKRSKGFTLIELLITIMAVVGLVVVLFFTVPARNRKMIMAWLFPSQTTALELQKMNEKDTLK